MPDFIVNILYVITHMGNIFSETGQVECAGTLNEQYQQVNPLNRSPLQNT